MIYLLFSSPLTSVFYLGVAFSASGSALWISAASATASSPMRRLEVPSASTACSTDVVSRSALASLSMGSKRAVLVRQGSIPHASAPSSLVAMLTAASAASSSLVDSKRVRSASSSSAVIAMPMPLGGSAAVERASAKSTCAGAASSANISGVNSSGQSSGCSRRMSAKRDRALHELQMRNRRSAGEMALPHASEKPSSNAACDATHSTFMQAQL